MPWQIFATGTSGTPDDRIRGSGYRRWAIKGIFGGPILRVAVLMLHDLPVNPRFRVYLAVVACVALVAISAGAWLEYGGVTAIASGQPTRAVALILVGMSVTAAALVGLFSAWTFCSREADVFTRYSDYPDEPWRWKAEWESGRIVAGQSFPVTVTAVAGLWVSLTIGVALLTGDQWRSADFDMAWLIPTIPLVGVGLLVAAGRSLLRWRRFGASHLQLEDTPVVPTGNVAAVIETGIRSDNSTAVFRVTVTCRREVIPDVRHSHSRRETILWRDVADFCGVSSHERSGFLAVPITFQIPRDLPDSSVRNSSDRTIWEVSVSGTENQLKSYSARFEIPVFSAGEDEVVQTSPVSSVYRAERIAAPEVGTIVSPGIEITSDPQRVEVVFKRGRERRLAGVLVQFAILWAVVTAVVFKQNIHVFVPLVLGAFTFIPLVEAFRLALVERRIVATRRSVDLIRRVGGLERIRRIDVAQLQEINVTAVADIGMRERYRLTARMSTGESMVLAERIPDQLVAQWLGLQVGAAAGIRQTVTFRPDIAAAPPRGPIRRERMRRYGTHPADEAA